MKKLYRKIEKATVEKNKEVVTALKTKLIDVYNEYEELFDDGDAPEEEHNRYCEHMKEINVFVDELPAAEPDCSSRLLQAVNLPRLEIKTFTGDPREYITFAAIFKDAIAKHVSGERDKLVRLMQATSGRAHEAITSCAILQDQTCFERAWTILGERFGSPHVIADLVVNDIRIGGAARTPEELTRLSDQLTNAELILKELDMFGEVDSQRMIVEICRKLPEHITNRWRDRAIQCRQKSGVYPVFLEFVAFVKVQADGAADPVYGERNFKEKDPGPSRTSHTLDVSSPNPLCIMCHDAHDLQHCNMFLAKSIQDRVSWVRERSLCFNCLKSGHYATSCFRQQHCHATGCPVKHNSLLHADRRIRHQVDAVVNTGVQSTSNVCAPVVSAFIDGVEVK